MLIETERKTSKLMQDNTRLVRFLVYAVLAVGVVGYIAWQVNSLIKPPALVIQNPQESAVVYKSQLLVTGSVEPESEMTINGEVVLPKGDGTFEQRVYVMPGVNQFIFEAKKRYSKPITITRTIEYREPIVQGDTVRLGTN